MLVADFIKISLETLKVMSKNNIMLSDRDLINAYDDFIELRRHNFWLADFGANIAGNAAYDGALWLLKALFRR